MRKAVIAAWRIAVRSHAAAICLASEGTHHLTPVRPDEDQTRRTSDYLCRGLQRVVTVAFGVAICCAGWRVHSRFRALHARRLTHTSGKSWQAITGSFDSDSGQVVDRTSLR